MEKIEKKNLEYKSEISKTFLKTVSAFANYRNGRIIFGVNNDGIAIGLKGDLNKLALDIENSINDNIEPKPDFDISIDYEYKVIELFVFKGVYIPYTYKGKAYKRNDTSTVEVDRDEFRDLFLNSSNMNFEELKAKNQKLNFTYLDNELKEKLNLKDINIDTYKTLDLYSDDIGFNNAAYILADENKFNGVDIIKFGDSIDEIFERSTIENVSIFKQFDEAVKMYKRYYQYERIKTVSREKIELIPEKAFREAIVNALVHRIYNINSNITVYMYKDRIEVTSPGGLPKEVSNKDYLYGQLSILRNPIIGNILMRLKYIERIGSGIQRINEAYRNCIIKPQYRIYDGSITVTLPISVYDKDILNENEHRILSLIKLNNEMTRQEIEEEMCLSKDKTIRLLNDLVDKHIIGKKGNIKSTKYICL